MLEENLVSIYVNADFPKRVDIIFKHYSEIIGLVDGYTEGLR